VTACGGRGHLRRLRQALLRERAAQHLRQRGRARHHRLAV